MTRDSDIIGTPPKPDLGPLFAVPDVRSVASHGPPSETHARRREARDAELDRRSTFPYRLPDAEDRATKREAIKRALLPRVLEIAAHSASCDPPGFTADDVRALALEMGLITGAESEQRANAFIGPWLFTLARRSVITWLRDADGRPVERPSQRPEAHKNGQSVYVSAPRAVAA